MSLLRSTWRGSLAATALWSILAAAPVAAVADEPRPTSPPAEVREQAQKQFREIREKAADLDKKGKHEDADRLRREGLEIMKKAGFGRDDGKPRPDSRDRDRSNPETDRIREQVREMFKKAEQLDKDGKHEDAEHLRREAKSTYLKLNGHTAAGERSDRPDGAEANQKLHALQERIEKAKREGNREEVEHLLREVDTMRSRLSSRGPERASRPDVAANREERLQHLRAAAENLKAAGFDSDAQHVMQILERMRSEAGGDRRPRDDSPPSRDLANSPAVQELRGQVEQMRREMREMREELNRAKGGERR